MWTTAPSLLTPRECLSSCALGDDIFSFYGYNQKDGLLDSIERLSAKAFYSGQDSDAARWELVQLRSANYCCPEERSFSLVTPFGKDEIFIFGG